MRMSSRPATIRVSGRPVSRTSCYVVARSAIVRARFGEDLAAAARSANAADRPPMPPPTITTRTDRIRIKPIPVIARQGSTRYLRPPRHLVNRCARQAWLATRPPYRPRG
jgi:hypothetical protein